MADRARLVVTADGVLRYKLASQEDGKQLVLTLFDVDLAWAPPRLAVKTGPIEDVRAAAAKGADGQVRVDIRLRSARPYHVRRDQNQVVVEVEKVTEAEAVAEQAHRGGDLMHRITLNVQNEDLPSLVKALAFEAGFDNIVLNPSVQGKVTITLREVAFAKAMNLILSPVNLVWKIDRGVLRVANAGEFDTELTTSALSGGGAASAAGGGDEEPVSTRVFRLKYIPLALGQGIPGGSPQIPSIVVQSITGILLLPAPKGKVDIDQRTNSLVITDATTNFPKIQRLIRELDVKVPQVMIRARLIEVNRDRTDTMGIDWTIEQAGPTNPATSAVATGATPSPYQLHTGWLGPGFNLDATLHLLQIRGDAKLLLNPSIATLQDQPAHVETLEQTAFSQISQTIVNGQVVNTQTFVQVPVPMTLDVVPHINPDGTVNLRVKITQTTATPQLVGPPNTRAETANTSLVVRNNETGVIGGILRDQAQSVVTKVPILGDLPWFLGGAFFRTEKTENVKFELVLFLTPSIAEEI